MAQETGEVVRDTDGTQFRHTNFFPAEQYDRKILEQLATMQREDLGEVEIHLHHGIKAPDTPENLRKTLIKFTNAACRLIKECLIEKEYQCAFLEISRDCRLYLPDR